MQTKVFDMAGKQVGEITLSDAVFGIEPNEAVVHDVVKNHNQQVVVVTTLIER